jgi:hypothetical protein
MRVLARNQPLIADSRISKATVRPQKNKIPIEIRLCTMLVVFIPGSLSTPWGFAGSYVCAAISVLAVIGIVHLNPSLKEIRRGVPMVLVALIVLSTFFSLAVGRLDLDILRGSPFQVAAFVSTLSFVRVWRRRGGLVHPWLRWTVAISIVVASIAVIEYLTKSYIEIDSIYKSLTGIDVDDSVFRRSADSFRAISTAGNPLMLGMFCSIAACVALSFYLRFFRIYYLLAFVINAAASVATMSRSSWIALLLGCGVVTFRRLAASGRISHRAYLHYFGFLLLAGVLMLSSTTWNAVSAIWSNVVELATNRMEDFSDTVSYTHRLTAPVAAIADLSTYPLSLLIGYGVGAENHFFFSGLGIRLTGDPGEDGKILRTFDNTFVTVMYSFGLIGLAWLVTIIIKAFRSEGGERSNEDWYFGALAATICAVFFFNAFGSPLANFFLAALLGFGAQAQSVRPRSIFNRFTFGHRTRGAKRTAVLGGFRETVYR